MGAATGRGGDLNTGAFGFFEISKTMRERARERVRGLYSFREKRAGHVANLFFPFCVRACRVLCDGEKRESESAKKNKGQAVEKSTLPHIAPRPPPSPSLRAHLTRHVVSGMGGWDQQG